MMTARPGQKLSRSQWLIWCLVVNGATSQQVAYSLGITKAAVGNQRHIIKVKRGTIGKSPWAL